MAGGQGEKGLEEGGDARGEDVRLDGGAEEVYCWGFGEGGEEGGAGCWLVCVRGVWVRSARGKGRGGEEGERRGTLDQVGGKFSLRSPSQ